MYKIYIGGFTMTDFKEFVEELKSFYNVKSLEAVAEKMGFNKHSATGWRRDKKLTSKALLKYNDDRNKIGKVKEVIGFQNESKSKEITINFYENVTASAGYGIASMENKPKKMAFDCALLQGLKIQNRNNLDIIKISGDSMLPYFNDGDLIIVERECEAKNGDTIIANIAGDLYVKQLEKDPFNKWVRLVSTNKDYGSILLEGQEVESLNIVGIVRARINVRVY